MKAHVWKLFHLPLALSVVTSLPSVCICPLFLPHLSICPLFILFPPFLHFSIRLLQPFLPSFIPPHTLSPLYHLSTSLWVRALQSQLCPSQQHRLGNESLPSPPLRSTQWHGAPLSPFSQRGGRMGWRSVGVIQVSMERPPHRHFISLWCRLAHSRLRRDGGRVKDLSWCN